MMNNSGQQNGKGGKKGLGLRRTGLMAGMICLAVMVGMALSPLTNVQAEVRTPAVPENVPSSGAQAVPVLREIAATLRQIDGRLARLERMATEASGSVDSTGR